MELITSSITPMLGGAFSHAFFFKQGEKHLYPERYIQVFIGACVMSVVAYMRLQEATLGVAVQQTSWISGYYLMGLYGSVAVYRLFFNPLNKFPGPFWARLSSFFFVFQVGRKKNGHYYLEQLHKRYGRIVRIGPNDLSITDADFVQVVSSAQSKCIRSPFYDQGHPITSLHVTRDPKVHEQRRRVWSRAFSNDALHRYEERLERYNDELIQQVQDHKGQPMNMTQWFNFYSFDVMGDLGFGQSFGMIRSGDMHWAIQILQDGLAVLGFYFPPWMVRLFQALPGSGGAMKRFEHFFIEQLHKRMGMEGKLDEPDISHYLIDHFNKSDPNTQKHLIPMLQGDTRLIIIAGSDTTAITLTYLFYYMAAVPGLLERVRREINEIAEDGHLDSRKLQTATLVTDCIKETLRLHPPVASGVGRKTPKCGVNVRDIWIPGDTVIRMPWYAMGRDPEYFPSPDEFIPERFSTRPELITHKSAWGPFNIGPYNCIGQRLAYMEIRGLTAALLAKFDVALAAGEDGKSLISDARDTFTLGLPPFYLTFNPTT